MKALVIKDILNLKKQYRVLGLLFGFYLIFGLAAGQPDAFSGVITMMMVLLTITSMSYDERSHWDKYALTMTVSRRELVLSKYVLGVLLSLLAFLLNLPMQKIAGSLPWIDALMVSAMLTGLALFLLAVLLPLMFHFGVEKGRILMMIVFLVPTALILILGRAGLTFPDGGPPAWLPGVAAAVLAGVLGLSLWLSFRIMGSKEF